MALTRWWCNNLQSFFGFVTCPSYTFILAKLILSTFFPTQASIQEHIPETVNLNACSTVLYNRKGLKKLSNISYMQKRSSSGTHIGLACPVSGFAGLACHISLSTSSQSCILSTSSYSWNAKDNHGNFSTSKFVVVLIRTASIKILYGKHQVSSACSTLKLCTKSSKCIL